jgi:spermidine/putrescine transport system substrate-binding protein
MSDRSERSLVDPELMESIMRARLTRRGFLKGAGTGAAAFSLGAFLTACGGGTSSTTFDPAKIFAGKAGSKVNFANWPVYIDQAKDASGNVVNPSIVAFETQTGMDVNYQAIIQDNPSFFGKLQPQLQAGDNPGWDIIVITNGREFTALVQNKWVYPLDTSKRPNFSQNATDWAKDPTYDPGAKHSMAWQSGITGIGYNKDLVKAPVESIDDLANPAIVGKQSVGMLTSDMPNFVMVNLGIDPIASTPADWQKAADWLIKQRDSGTVRQYYDQGYLDDLTAGNLTATMAWSGDITYNQVWAGYDNLEFVFPTGGALLWVDNMMIPAHASNPVGALQLMDYYYEPRPAADVDEFVFYMSPCAKTQSVMLADAAKAEAQGQKGYAAKLSATAKSPFLFPDQSFLSRTSFGRDLKTDAERQQWDDIFLPISQG